MYIFFAKHWFASVSKIIYKIYMNMIFIDVKILPVPL